ncbi:hypothetical protein ACJMK2_008225, partial [Sinanodonta woodiana]
KLPFYTVRMYRFMSELHRRTGIHRNQVVKRTTLTKKQASKQNLNLQVTSFLGKEDNSSVLVTKKKSDVVNFIDYMHNLHDKFHLENPDIMVSRARFYQSRPKYLSLGLNLPKSPDAFIKEQDTNEKLKETLETGLPDMVKYTQWETVVEGQKSRWKEVDEAVAKTDCIHLMDSQTSEFRNHVKRVKVQYQEMRNLRENLPENEVMLWMDFAENIV